LPPPSPLQSYVTLNSFLRFVVFLHRLPALFFWNVIAFRRFSPTNFKHLQSSVQTRQNRWWLDAGKYPHSDWLAIFLSHLKSAVVNDWDEKSALLPPTVSGRFAPSKFPNVWFALSLCSDHASVPAQSRHNRVPGRQEHTIMLGMTAEVIALLRREPVGWPAGKMSIDRPAS
jgi:hypothetical protein